SVLAVMIDDSVSMRVRDAGSETDPKARLAAAVDLLSAGDRKLLDELSKQHQVRVYRFDSAPQAVETVAQKKENDPAVQRSAWAEQLARIEPTGQNTQVVRSVRAVLDDLQGQRVAGIVVLTDGRETPAQPTADALTA